MILLFLTFILLIIINKKAKRKMNKPSAKKIRKLKKVIYVYNDIDDNKQTILENTQQIKEFKKVPIDEYFISFHQQENHDMGKEDININLFYIDLDEIKKTIKNMYIAVKEYRRLDFGGKLLYLDNQINTYELKLEGCDKFMNSLIGIEDEIVTKIDKNKLKIAYNQALLNRKEIIENKPKQDLKPLIDKIKKHRQFLLNYIHEKMNILVEKYNIHINPFKLNP